MGRGNDRRKWLIAGALALAAGAGAGCSINVEAPQLQAQSMEFTGIDGNGLAFRVVFVAYNSNSFTLNLRNLEARLAIEGHDAGSSVTVLAADIPPGRWVPVTANVTMPWSGAPQHLLTLTHPTVNYTLDGQVTVDHYISVRARFQTGGQMPREFFLRGATQTVNSMINSVLPGFGGVQVQ